MKKITLFLFLLSIMHGNAQEVGNYLFNDFNQGTLQGWTNSDGTTSLLTLEDFPDPESWQEDYKILQKICDGSQTSVGEMAILKTMPFPMPLGNFDGGGGSYFSHMDFFIRNQNDFDIKLNVGFKDSQGRRIVFTEVNLPTVPADSGWVNRRLWLSQNSPELQYLDDSFDYSQVVEVKIFHNDSLLPSYNGLFVEGVLEIDHIFPFITLSVEDFNISNIVLSPNPTQDKLTIISETQISGYHIYDLFGRLVNEGVINNSQYVMDLGRLPSGTYLIELTSNQGKETHKIIKK